jgi:apolipoprotein N-acyltransferase
MSDLDVAKEEIAYLKVWLGILVITDISTFGWLISNLGQAAALLLWAAVLAVIGLSLGILLLHRLIKSRIRSLKDL